MAGLVGSQNGTFSWHPQVGIFLAAGAIASLAVAAHGIRPAAALGWLLGPLAFAGVVYTTSRGSQLALAVGIVCLCTTTVLHSSRWRAFPRLLTALTASAGMTVLLAGPPFPAVAAWGGAMDLNAVVSRS